MIRMGRDGKAAHWLAAAAVLAALGGAPAAAGAQPAAPGEAGRVFDFAIPSKPLLSALVDFTATTGIQVIRPDGEAIGGTAPAVSGRLTAAQALQALLAGSGLGFRVTNAETITLVPRPSGAEGSVMLPEVRVDAGALRGWSPVRGFVAGVSATGTKTDTPLIETPQSISVVTRDQMQAQGAQSVADALRYTAGTIVSPLGLQNKDTFYIRGFGDTDGGGQQYLDGMRLIYPSGFAQPQIDPWNLERVEVLRGPASVLYGQASPGGIVNMVSRRPTDETIRQFGFQAGSFNQYAGMFDFGGRVDEDGRFLFRLSGLGRVNDTQFQFNRQARLSISPVLTWRPSADTSFTVLTNIQQDKPGGRFYNLVPAYGSVLPNRNANISRDFTDADPNYNSYTRSQYSIGYILDHRFNETWSMRQNFRYMHTDGEYRDVFSAGLQPDQRTLNRYTRLNREHMDALTLDNQVQARFATGGLAHTVLAGVDYRHTRDDNAVGLGVAPALDLFAPVYGSAFIGDPAYYTSTVQTLDQVGVYAQDQVRWGRWNFLIGVRGDSASNDTRSRLANTTTRQSDSAFTWRTGLVYRFDNGLAPYASYSTSFFPTAGTAFGGGSFRPTTGQQYEVGLKFQPNGFNSFVTLAAFHLTQQNVLTADPNPAHLGFSVQTGEVRSRGIEFQANASLTNSLNLVATYTYLDNEVTRSNTTNLGKVPLYVPRHSASLWADYTIPAGRAAGLRLGGGVRFVGSTYGDTLNTFKVSSYEVFDATIRYDIGRLNPRWNGVQLSVNANNLFDREYVAGCGSTSACYFGNRRTILGGISYAW